MTEFAAYYIDAPTFADATAVYTDSLLTTKADDGFYQLCGVVREQSGGVLLPSVTCDDCGLECPVGVSVTGAQGVYRMQVDLGALRGQFSISLDPYTIPVGLRVVYDGVTYTDSNATSFISANDGDLSGIYVGTTGGDCGIVAGSPHTLDLYLFNSDTEVYDLTTINDVITITSGELDLGAATPGVCVMTIPKPFATPSIVTVDVIAPCSGSQFDLSVACAQQIPSVIGKKHFAGLVSFDSNDDPKGSSVLACAESNTETWYRIPVAGTGNKVGVNDIIFADSLGRKKLADYLGAGFYRYNALQYIEIDANSLVVSTGNC